MTTFASAIRIGEPVHREEVAGGLERSGGRIVTLSEDGARARRGARSRARRASSASPLSAAGIAAVEAAGSRGVRVVCVVTGHGLKDPDAV